MKIVADQNIPLLDHFFGDVGEIIKLPPDQITSAQLADADM